MRGKNISAETWDAARQLVVQLHGFLSKLSMALFWKTIVCLLRTFLSSVTNYWSATAMIHVLA